MPQYLALKRLSERVYELMGLLSVDEIHSNKVLMEQIQMVVWLLSKTN